MHIITSISAELLGAALKVGLTPRINFATFPLYTCPLATHLTDARGCPKGICGVLRMKDQWCCVVIMVSELLLHVLHPCFCCTWRILEGQEGQKRRGRGGCEGRGIGCGNGTMEWTGVKNGIDGVGMEAGCLTVWIKRVKKRGGGRKRNRWD